MLPFAPMFLLCDMLPDSGCAVKVDWLKTGYIFCQNYNFQNDIWQLFLDEDNL